MRSAALMTVIIAILGTGLGAALVPELKLPGVLIGGIAGELAISALLVALLGRWLHLPLRRFIGRVGDVGSSLAQLRLSARSYLQVGGDRA
jgi:hypothetical protein